MSLYINPLCVGYEYDGVTPLTFGCWQQVWVNGFTSPGCPYNYQKCGQTYNQAVFDNGNIDETAFLQSESDFIDIYTNYITTFGNNITIPGLPGYNVMQEAILDACNDLPGSCILASQRFVQLGQNGVAFTRESISSNAGLLNFYGCVTPPLTAPPEAVSNLVNDTQCDPLCNRINTIKLYSGSTQLECQRTVCIIDQVTINAVNSDASGLNFDQVCNNCANGGCTCIISGVDVNSIWSNINGNFNQDCGANSLCYQTNNIGLLVPVNCASVITNTGPTFPAYYYVIIGLIILLILITIAIVYYIRR